MTRRTRSVGSWLLLNLTLLAIAAVFGLPFLGTVVTAFDAGPPRALPWPRQPTLTYFETLFRDRDAGTALRNSLIVASAAMVFATITAAMAGYGLSRLHSRTASWLAYGALLLQSIPAAVTMVPIYDLAVRLQLQNTYQGLILAHASLVLPLLVWLMKGFTDTVPRTMEEEAWVDGASPLRAWWDIVVPATAPGLAVVAGFAFAYAWAEVLMVVILVTDVARETLPFQFFYAADGGGDAHLTAALGVLYVGPVLALFLALRRQLTSGMAATVEGL